ncbi:MAG: sulfotransferase [Bacteroidales bacterium]
MKISKNLDKIPFFFIIGRPRSGTTLLQTLFDAHPHVQIPPESPVIKECFDRFRGVHDWNKQEIHQFADYLFRVIKFKEWNIDKNKLLHRLLNYEGKLTFNTVIHIVYLNYQSVYNKGEIKILGDKNPSYSKFPEKMKAIFPDAKFIHIVRDYRDHILSMQRVNLLNSNLPLISYTWRKSQIKTFRFAQRFPDSIMAIRYEDFVKNPESNLKRMCEFLDINYDQSVLTYHEKEEAFKKEFKMKTSNLFHGNLFKPINSDNVNKWKSEMSQKDILKADFYVGKFAELSGYERIYPKRTFNGFFSCLPGYIYLGLYNVLLFSIKLIPIRTRKKIRNRFSN